MNLICERSQQAQDRRVYAFTTFFYPKLIKDGYSSLRRWTRKVDIFSHNLILVPVHLGLHWTLAVCFYFLNELNSFQKPHVLFFWKHDRLLIWTARKYVTMIQ
jgi:sentrin-specific protease 1